MSSRWAAKLSAGVGGNATRKTRWAYHLPLARLVFHFNDGHTMSRLRLTHFFGAPIGHAIGKQQAVVHVLVIHGQKTTLGAFLRVVMNPIVVHTQLGLLLGGGVAGVFFKSMVVARHAHRITPRRNHLYGISLRHGNGVCSRYRHTFKTHQWTAGHIVGGATYQSCSAAHSA